MSHTPSSADLETSILHELESRTIAKDTGLWRPLSHLLHKLRVWPELTYPYTPKGLSSSSCASTFLNATEQKQYAAFAYLRGNYRFLNTHYATQYTGSYVLNYKLAVLAVSLAVGSLALLYASALATELWKHLLHAVMLALGLLKLGCLILIAANTRQAARVAFNDRAIAYRFLMEQLRNMLYLPLLCVFRLPQPSASRQLARAVRSNYLEKFLQRRLRELRAELLEEGEPQTIHYRKRLVPILRFMRQEWVEGQMAYHRDKREKLEALDERLEKRVELLNTFVIGAVVVDLVIGALYLGHLVPALLHDVATPLILVTATIIPALVASYNALRFQTEARSLADRSESMALLLEDLHDRYGTLIASIEASEADEAGTGAFTIQAIGLANDTAQTMVDEVTEWTFIYSNLVMDA